MQMQNIGLIEIMIIIFIIVFYFLPSLIAYYRRHKNLLSIFIRSRPQNRAIHGANGVWPLSIPLLETTGFSPRSFILNLFLGWTLIGWVIALAWPVMK